MIGQYGALCGAGAVIGAAAGALLSDRIGRASRAYGALFLVSLMATIIGLSSSSDGLLFLGIVWGMAWGFQSRSLWLWLWDWPTRASRFPCSP